MSRNSRRVVQEILFPMPEEVPVKLGWFRTEGGRRIHPLAMHAEIELQFIKSGSGAYAIGRRIWPFKGRTLFVIRPNVPHRFQPNPEGVVEKMFVAFQPAWLKKQCGHALIPALPEPLLFTEQNATPVELCYRTLRSELAAKAYQWEALITGELVKLLILIQRATQTNNPPPAPDSRVIKTMEYLDTHYQDIITVPDLARIAAMSPSHLAHRFKQHVKMGIRQYLLQRRIIEAKLILEQTPDIKLAALAAQLGFCSFSLFNRAFHHLTGMSPSDWRRLSHL